MTDEEVNKIIAEFMGWRFLIYGGVPVIKKREELPIYDDCFTKSLDALVPVWEKLECRPTFEYDYAPDSSVLKEFCELSSNDMRESPYGYSSGSTIKQAAAYATAKAIQRLND